MKLIKLVDYLDYKNFLPLGFAEATEATNIPANSYSWNEAYRALRINDASASLKGSLTIRNFEDARVGDVVEFKAEIMNVSGVKGKIAIDYDDASNLVVLQSEKIGEFESVGGKFVVTKDKKLVGVIGVFTEDIGDFYVRNVEIKINGKEDIIKTDIRVYNFVFGVSSLALQSGYNPYTCTTSVSATDILITHDKPFLNPMPGNAFAAVSATGLGKMMAKVKSESSSSLRVEFYDMTTGTRVNPTTLYGTTTYFSVVHHGYRL